MSKSHQKIPSPARSAGAVTPRRARRTLSTASRQSEGSVKLSAVVEKFCKDDFVLSPLKRRSVLQDDTGIEAPRRASWWKRLDGSSRDVLEALDTNKMTDDLLVEEYEFEVEKDKQNQSVPESSDNESVASIIVPQKRLFNQKKQPQAKFVDMASRKSLGKTNIEDQSIELAPKTLFNKGPRNKPVFPAALLNSTNKTINKTVEPEPTKQTRPNLFGHGGTKRKNMFADFVLSDSEEDSEVHHKVFGFKKNNNKRISLGTRTRRMPSLTPSMTTEIDIDDWNLLPSSTMIGAQEVSRMSNDDAEQVQEENQDVTLTENNESLIRDTNNRSNNKSATENDENDKTLTNEDIKDASNQEFKMNESIKTNKSHEPSKAKLNESVKNKTIQNKSSTRANAENEVIEVVLEEQQNNAGTKNLITEINEPSIEDIMAELHGESIQKEKSRQNVKLDRTKENLERCKDTKTGNYKDGKETHEIEPSSGDQKLQDASKVANNAKQNEDDDLPEKDKSEEELEQIIEEQKSQNRPKDASIINQDEDLNDKSQKDKIEEEVDPSVEDQVSEEHSKEANKTNQEEDIEEENEEEIEPSAEEQETRDHSKEASDTNQDEDINDMSEIDKSEEEVEPSANGEENQHESNEVSHENEDEEMEDISAKDKSDEEVEPSDNDDENQHETTEVSHENEDEEMEDISEKDKSEEAEHESDENQDEDMEKMVWNDNDDEKESDNLKSGIDAESKQNYEVIPNEKGSESGKNRTVDRKDITSKSKNLTNKSHKIVESFVDNDQMEEEVVDETPNNSTHDTTGRNRKKETIIKSPEAVLQNMTNDNESFRPIGRSTTFRKSKSMYEMMNRPSLAPVQESTLGSEGSRNSSTEGSEWDSHRTTRKTIRQTLGKEYTTRKSLRALVMEQSAKRQTEIYNKNMSNINKTKNKTVLEGNDKNASKINKTKTVLEDANKTATIVKTKNSSVLKDKNSSTINKTKNTTILEDVNNKNAAINKTKNKTVLDDVNDQHIRHRTSNRSLSTNQSRISSVSVHGTSTHHVPDPLIRKHQISHHKSLHELNDPEIPTQDSINILDNNDSGPEISMNASYGQGMSADTAHEGSVEEHKATDVEIDNSPKQIKEIPRNTSIRSRSIPNSDQEILDYEASELEKSEQEMSESEQENVEQDSMQQSVQDNENEDLEPESEEVEAETDHGDSEQENENSQQEIEAESDNEESQQEIESEQEEPQQEIAESDNEESQQEIESEQEESQQEIAESDNEESQQEIESEQEESPQEIESEHETQQEIESDQETEPESENEQENDVSQPQSDNESDQENREPETVSDDDFVSGLNSRYHDNRSGVSRVVFDSRMMSVDEIDFEGVSRQTDDDNEGVTRQTDNDYTEQSVREPELSRNVRISEPSVHEVSVGTKTSLLLMQMQKIAQQNMELRQKISNQVEKSLKPTRNCNMMSPVPKYCIRRITKEPRRPTKKPTRTGVAMETLPKAFVEDLKYKPPKRFQKANAPWITKRLYKFLETKLEPRYDYRARVRAEELVQTIYSFCKLVRRRDLAPQQAVDELKREMARLRVVNTHFEFYDFFHEFMPTEVRIKVNPDVINKIPMPRNGIFGEILQSRTAVE